MASAVSPTVSATLARYAPEAGAAVEAMHAAAWETLDPTLLELCRRRMAMLHGDRAELARVPPRAASAGTGPLSASPKIGTKFTIIGTDAIIISSAGSVVMAATRIIHH